MFIRKKTSLGIILVFLFITLINRPTRVEASSTTYNVYNLRIVNNKIEKGSSLLTTTNFNTAKTEMKKYSNGIITSDKSPSPLQIVAATRGQAQSYPYRKGKEGASATLNIYSNKKLSSAHTYITAHYMMYVYDYEINEDNILIANVEIQGAKGYVEVTKTDIVPMLYMETGITISLGGKEQYYSKAENPYESAVSQEIYEVVKGDKYNEIRIKSFRPHASLGNIDLIYGIAPDYLQAGKQYYSPDGIRFYEDRELKKRIGKDYYAYYQWLPLRSASNHGPEAFEKLLRDYGKSNSIMIGQTNHFIEQGLKYGMNPVLIFQQANLESAYGTSKYALQRNNVFGWGAVDSDPDKAYSYDNIGQGIGVHMSTQIAGYMSVSDWRHYGPSFGNKGAGITVKYASDPYYGIKVASMYYRLDKLNGYKDYNAYNLSLLKDNTSYSVKQDKSTNSEWYKTKSNLKDQVIINLGNENNRIKTTLWMPNFEGVSYAGTFPLNLFEEFGYIASSGISSITSYGYKGQLPKPPSNWTPPKKDLDHDEKVKAVTTANVNFRKSFSTSSAVIATIPKGTELIVEPTNMGWARSTYNGQIGYISMTYLKIDEGSKPEEPKPEEPKPEEPKPEEPKPEEPKPEEPGGKYKKGDINGDEEIDILDMMAIRYHILGLKKFNSEDIKRADLNQDGEIDILDMMSIRYHILGIKLLK